MPNSPGPTQILINYVSPDAPHKMLLNALEWSPTPNVGGAGSLATWDAAGIDTQDAVENLVGKMKFLWFPETTFLNYVVFTYPTPEADPEPMASGVLNIVGTATGGGWYKAVQKTLTFRTNLFGLARIVALDANSDDNFDKNTVVPSSGVLFDLIEEFTSESNPWSGRDNGRPDVYLGVTSTLNEKLRRAYRMT